MILFCYVIAFKVNNFLPDDLATVAPDFASQDH
jgi:hypothetical protein